MSILFKKIVELGGGYHTVTKVMHDDDDSHMYEGEVYGFVVSLFDPACNELEWDSGWGVVGDLELVKAEAEAARLLMVEKFDGLS